MKQLKRIIAVVLCLACFTAIFPGMASAANDPAVSTGGSLSHFIRSRAYQSGQFSDVTEGQWFQTGVQNAYELGLMNGISASAFSPKGVMTVAEAVTLACRLHSIYYDDNAAFEQGNPWYQVYVNYALQNGILTDGEFSDYTKSATRSQFAKIMTAALPADALPVINSIADDALPDVKTADYGGTAVYTLYRAGILTGNDRYGTFTPASSIERSAVAAIVSRMADPGLRSRFTLLEKPVEATSIALSEQNLTLYTGDAKTLTTRFAPTNTTDKSVTYTSTNPSVASVNASGLVTALKAGTTTIKAKSSNGKAAVCTVTVTKRPPISAPLRGESLTSDGVALGFYCNSADGVTVFWRAKNQSGKKINYYTCKFSMYNSVGDPAYDEITGKYQCNIRIVGPVEAGEELIIYNIIGYTPVCSRVYLTSITLEYADGTKETVPYGYSGGETLWDQYNNNWMW